MTPARTHQWGIASKFKGIENRRVCPHAAVFYQGVRFVTKMTQQEKELFLADLHVGVLAIPDASRGPLTVRCLSFACASS